MLNFSSLLLRNADRRPQAEALAAGSRRLTNQELLDDVQALAAGLRSLGVERGDRVAILLYNCPEFLETTFAVNWLGAVWLPLNYRLAPDELQWILDNAGARVIVSEPELAPLVDTVARNLPELRERLLVGGEAPGWTPLTGLMEAHRGEQPPLADVGEDDLQRLMYTSGTTSRPKGVMISHGNALWKVVGHLVEFGITSADCTLVVGPLYHVGGMDLPGTGTLYAGGSLVVLRRFDPLETLEAIRRERPTMIWLAPSMVNAILALPGREAYDTTSIRLVIGGGEKMPVPLMERVLRAFPNAWVSDAYGLTETVSGDTFLDRDHVISKIGSVGKPILHLAMRVVDEQDQDLPPDELGEVLFRGPKVCLGYWRNPEATADALRGGWLHTGDIGRIDEDGYLFVEDRKKDLIVSGGENIASSEIERVLYEHPAVLEAAAIGVPDPRWGERPKVYVALREGAVVSGEDLLAFCRERLARFKVPDAVEFVEALPRNPSGKVLKRELRDRERAQRA